LADDQLARIGPVSHPKIHAAARASADRYVDEVTRATVSESQRPSQQAGSMTSAPQIEIISLTGRHVGAAIAAVSEHHRHEPDEVLVARREPDGTLRSAGGVRFGLDGHRRDQRRAALRRLEERARGRSGVRRVRPLLEVDIDSHGRPGGPLRENPAAQQ
jgi:hypothetical protein